MPSVVTAGETMVFGVPAMPGRLQLTDKAASRQATVEVSVGKQTSGEVEGLPDPV